MRLNFAVAVKLYFAGTEKFVTGNTVNVNSNHFEITSAQQLRFDNSNNNRTSEILNDGSSGNSVLTFKTNGGDRWTIDSTGHFIPGTAGAWFCAAPEELEPDWAPRPLSANVTPRFASVGFLGFEK